MKKSIPVSDDLAEYFTNPCPVLSDNNAQLIFDEIRKGYDYVVEYGMGSSTLYFLKAAQNQKTKVIAVENNFDWFEICINEVSRQTEFKQQSYSDRAWTLGEISRFVKGNSNSDAPDNLKRFPRWKESLSTGPFFRLSPESRSRFSGKLGPLWPVLKPAFAGLTRIIYFLQPKKRPRNGEWTGRQDKIELILRNVGPSIKDQYGEAPNMMDYIDAGLKDIKAALDTGKIVTAVFIVDGGPRHKIVQEILSLEDRCKNFKPTIFLCDASRIFYHKTLAQRSMGRFIAGSGKTFKGLPVANDVTGESAKYWTGGDKTAAELAQQEVWFYQSRP